VCTEYKRAGLTFRCHPNFRRQGKWFDWANFQFEVFDHETNEVREEIMPCRIMGVLSPEYNPSLKEYVLIVSSCLQRFEEQDSVLFHEWEWEDDRWYKVSAATLHSPTFVVHGLDTEHGRVCTVVPISEWPALFSASFNQEG